jgi:hypothetical protein
VKIEISYGFNSYVRAGLSVGSMVTRLYMEYRFSPPKKGPSEMRAFIPERFSHKLDLTEEQTKKFKAKIDQVGEKLDEHFLKTHSAKLSGARLRPSVGATC